MLDYTNIARMDPALFADYVRDELATFIDDKRLPLNKTCKRATKEGKAVWL